MEQQEMTCEEIRKEKERCFAEIQTAENRLKEIRAICPHVNTFEGTWSWRIGVYDPAIICSDCGSLVKNLNQVIIPLIQKKENASLLCQKNIKVNQWKNNYHTTMSWLYGIRPMSMALLLPKDIGLRFI